MGNISTNWNLLRKIIRLSVTNIVLIGFMGSGKSSIGRVLAKEKKSYFLDTDAMIESAEGKTIQALFDEEGEAYFRELEKQTVHWLHKNVQDAVISTGGGMLVYCEELKEVGKIVYLKVPFKTILSRMTPRELEKRPLFKDLSKAEEMYRERNTIYEQRADTIIDADAEIETVLSRVRAAIS